MCLNTDIAWIGPCQCFEADSRQGYKVRMKNHKFSPGPDRSISWHMRKIGHILERHDANLSKALRGLGLNAPMWRILNGLRENDDATIGDLAIHSAFERSYVSRVVARMEKLGLIETQADELDARLKVVRMTPAGWNRYAEAIEVVKAVNNGAIKGLTESEADMLSDLLDRIAANVGATSAL